MEVNDMKTPKIVLFDYGQTLIAEQKFDGVKGTEAVLQYATRNKYQRFYAWFIEMIITFCKTD